MASLLTDGPQHFSAKDKNFMDPGKLERGGQDILG